LKASAQALRSSFQVCSASQSFHATETQLEPSFRCHCLDCPGLYHQPFHLCGRPVTGAHFNPLITMGTFTARLSSLPRTALYIAHQCIGAVIGAYLVRAALGLSPKSLQVVPGCYIDSKLVAPAEAFASRVSCVSFSSSGIRSGLDPRNETAFGPLLRQSSLDSLPR